MGRWFARFFRDRGYRVTITGRSPDKAELVAYELGVNSARTNSEAASEADIILVATPIDNTVGVIREIHRHMKKGVVLFDIASVKADITRALEEAATLGARTVSIHPMFGPGAESMRGQRILLIPVGEDSRLTHQLTELFEREGAIVHLVPDGETHDRMMALTLALPYFLNAVFALAIPSNALVEVKKFSGTTFTLQLLIAESILQDLDLCAQLQTANKAFQRLLEETLRSVERLAETVFKGDRGEVEKILEEARARLALDPDFSRAYEKFYAALKAAI